MASITNTKIISKVNDMTADDPDMRKFLREMLSRECAGKQQFKKFCDSELWKMVEKRRMTGKEIPDEI